MLFRSSREIYRTRLNKKNGLHANYWTSGWNNTMYHLRVQNLPHDRSRVPGYVKTFDEWDKKEGALLRTAVSSKKPHKSDGKTRWDSDEKYNVNVKNLKQFNRYGQMLAAFAKSFAYDYAYTTVATVVEFVGMMLRAGPGLSPVEEVRIPNMLPGHIMLVLASMGGPRRFKVPELGDYTPEPREGEIGRAHV